MVSSGARSATSATTRRAARWSRWADAVRQYPGAAHIDPTVAQHLTDLGEPLGHVVGEGDLVLSAVRVNRRRGADLEGGELPGEIVVAATSGHFGDVGRALCLVV